MERGGTITEGSASPLNDGASAVLLGRDQAAAVIRVDPIAQITGRSVMALEPPAFGYAPGEAVNRVPARAGVGRDQVGAVEFNEVFAVQSVACIDARKVNPGRVNQKGGAIAIGHPLGASARHVLATAAKVLREAGSVTRRRELFPAGQGRAEVVENCGGTEVEQRPGGHRRERGCVGRTGIEHGATDLVVGFGLAGMPFD
ncbi:hypothetical protein ABZT06_13415 [Streptomyces sp. NPDC005483]|uniref:hypothetical protein n=1 Tax=Streptomyces sp. NPDC005483 TaxID=3154882 RepID=UPI0033BDBDE5